MYNNNVYAAQARQRGLGETLRCKREYNYAFATHHTCLWFLRERLDERRSKYIVCLCPSSFSPDATSTSSLHCIRSDRSGAGCRHRELASSRSALVSSATPPCKIPALHWCGSSTEPDLPSKLSPPLHSSFSAFPSDAIPTGRHEFRLSRQCAGSRTINERLKTDNHTTNPRSMGRPPIK
jgi:hypothetical protein